MRAPPDMMVKFAIALLVFSLFEKVVETDTIDMHETAQEKPASQKGRLSLQNTGLKIDGYSKGGTPKVCEPSFTPSAIKSMCSIGICAFCVMHLLMQHMQCHFDGWVQTAFLNCTATDADIQHCLVSAGDVGCGVFECFENNSCEIRGLQEICMTFLHNAGKFDSQGKSFIKDALKCMAHGLRHKFSCISRKCLAIKDMVFQLQRECYVRHNLCSAAKDNVNVMVEMIHFQDLFPKGPYVELVNILLGCGEEVKEAITRSVRLQCEQNWGALCDSLSFCSTLPPAPERRHGAPLHPEAEHPSSPKGSRHGEKDKAGKGGFNPHSRSRGQGPRRLSADAAVAEQEDPETTDIRR